MAISKLAYVPSASEGDQGGHSLLSQRKMENSSLFGIDPSIAHDLSLLRANGPSLIAIVLEVTPLHDGRLPLHVGNANLAATLSHLARFDADWVALMHDEDAPKPLTCSTLMGPLRREQGMARVRRGERYWLRVTGVTREVSALLAVAFLYNPPTVWQLTGQQFEVVQTICDPTLAPWSGATTYDELWLAPAPQGDKISLEFASPTAFRSDGMTQTLPQPDLVFGSLLDRWNYLSPLPLDIALRSWCRAAVEASRFDLETILFESKQRIKLVGAVGTITYWVRDPQPEGARLLHLLTEFAFYSGVGMKTTMGMGQVRRFLPNSAKI